MVQTREPLIDGIRGGDHKLDPSPCPGSTKYEHESRHEKTYDKAAHAARKCSQVMSRWDNALHKRSSFRFRRTAILWFLDSNIARTLV